MTDESMQASQTRLDPNTGLPVEGAKDPISGAAEGWEQPKFPLLHPDRICRFKIARAKREKSRSSDLWMIAFTLKTEKDYEDDEGKTIRAGSQFFSRVTVTPIEPKDGKRGRTWKNIGEELGMWLKAVGMAKVDVMAFNRDPSMIEGQIIDLRIGVDKGSGNYGPSNTFRPVLPG